MKLRHAAFLMILCGFFSLQTLSPNQEALADNLSMKDLEKLVAPVALYPDPLLAQLLPASTYPLEIVDAARIIHSDSDFPKIDSQTWDASVKAVAHYPSVLKMMNDKLSWTQQLGQAVLNQQKDVLQAVQDLRSKAQKAGNLKTTSQQQVQTTSNDIEILPANPQVVYVPVYNTETVYTEPSSTMDFGMGFAMGAWLTNAFYWPGYNLVWGGGYLGGYRGWNNVTVNNFNNNNVWRHDNNQGNPYNGRAGNYNPDNSPFSKNSNWNASQVQKDNLQKFQNGMKNTANPDNAAMRQDGFSGNNLNRGANSNFDDRASSMRQDNSTMFGDHFDGGRINSDSMRGFDSRGGGGFGDFGGMRGGGGFGGGGGFRGGGGFGGGGRR